MSTESDSAPSFKDLIQYLREEGYIGQNERVTDTTLVEKDLGITGDDGMKLLKSIESRFGVSFSYGDNGIRPAFGLEKDEYLFHSEGIGPFPLIIPWIVNLIRGRNLHRPKVYPLSLGHLYDVIIKLHNKVHIQ
jgi:hypothetical protein